MISYARGIIDEAKHKFEIFDHVYKDRDENYNYSNNNTSLVQSILTYPPTKKETMTV